MQRVNSAQGSRKKNTVGFDTCESFNNSSHSVQTHSLANSRTHLIIANCASSGHRDHFVEGALGTVRYGTLACCLGDLQTSREGETRHFGDPKDGVRYLNSLTYVLAVELEPEPTKPHFLWSLLKHIIEKSTLLLDLKKSATSYSGPNTENAIMPHHCRCHS